MSKKLDIRRVKSDGKYDSKRANCVAVTSGLKRLTERGREQTDTKLERQVDR